MSARSLSLLRTMAASTSRINIIRYSKDPHKRRMAIWYLVGYALLGIMCVPLLALTAFGLAQSGQPQAVPQLTAATISLVALILTLLKSNGYLYGFKEYDMLMSLPFSVRTIVSTRFLYMYLLDLPLCAIISLSTLVGYAIVVQPGVGLIAGWILLTPFVPLLPTVVGSLVGVVLANIGARSRHAQLIQTVLTFAIVIPLFFVQYIIRFVIQDNKVDSVIAQSSQTMDFVARVVPTVGWFTRATLNGDVLAGVLLVAVSLALYLGMVALISANYRRINSSLANAAPRHRGSAERRPYAQQSIVVSIAKKDFRRIMGSTVCATNLGLGTVLCLLAGIVLPFVNVEAIISAMAQGMEVNLAPYRLVWPLFVYFFVGMVPVTVVTPSLEGKSDWIIRSLPVSSMTVCHGRMLLNLGFSLLPGLFAVTMGFVALHAEALEFVLGLGMITVLVLFSTAYGMRCGLKHLRLDWQNEVEVVKQGAAVTFYLLPNMFATMAASALFILCCNTLGGAVGALVIMAVYGILGFLAYSSLRKTARQRDGSS